MTKAATLWRCPRCGRQFRTRNQSHSCVSYTVESHFEGKPSAVRALYDLLLAEVRRFGPVRVDAVPSGINFAASSHFAGVQAQRRGLRVGFILERELDDPRMVRTEPLGPSKRAYSVRVDAPTDLDEQLVGWLAEAYALRA
jgi:hypothetical protein